LSGAARLSLADRANLRIERPETPSHVGGLCLVEARPLLRGDGELDRAAIRRRLELRLVRAPELRRVVRRPPPFCGPPFWVDDPDFSIERHVRAVRVESPGDEAGLLRAVELLLRSRLDRSHPLWELNVSVPAALRGAGAARDLGNAVGAMIVAVPVGEPDASHRLERIAAATRAARATQHPASVQDLMAWLAALGLSLPFTRRQRLVDSFVTNVPGPRDVLYFLGARIEAVLPLVGPAGAQAT
jgi:hypothetical protein